MAVFYATADELRDELELTIDQLSTAAAERQIRRAERLVDRLVGPRAVDAATGRKIVPTDLTQVQAEQLRDATVLLAAAVQRNPDAFAPAAGDRVKGPDFEIDKVRDGTPAGTVALREATALLDDADLRVLTARAAP